MRCAGFIFSLLVCVCRAAEETPETRIYDVSDIIRNVESYPAWSFGPAVEPPGPYVCIFTGGAPGMGTGRDFTVQSLADMIRTRIWPESWAAEKGVSIEERGGFLVIMQIPSVHRDVSAILKRFRERWRMQVSVKGWLIAASALPRDSAMSTAALKKWIVDSAGKEISQPRFVCFNTQRAHVRFGREFNFIGGISGNEVRLPEMHVGLEGCSFDVCPRLSNDCRTATLEMFVNASFPAPAEAALPAKGKPGDTPPPFEVDSVAMKLWTLGTNMRVNVGEWSLAGMIQNPDKDAAEKNLLLFVCVDLLDKTQLVNLQEMGEYPDRGVKIVPAAPNAAPKAPMELQIYDVRDICDMPREFPAGDFGLRVAEKPNTPAVFSGFTSPDIAALLKDRFIPEEFVSPESSLEESHNKLVVLARKEGHKKVKAELDRLRKVAQPQVAVKATLVALNTLPDETLFEQSELNKILEAPGAQVLSTPKLMAAARQSARISAGTSSSYISRLLFGDENIESTQATVFDGMQFEIRAFLPDDRSCVRLDLRFGYNANVQKTRRAGSVAVPEYEEVPVTKENPVASKRRTGQSKAVVCGLDMVSMNTCTTQTQLLIPKGKWVLAASFKSVDRNSAPNLALFVTAESADVP